MSWITVTTEDIKPYLASAQLVALQTKALASGQADPTVALIADITGRVRALVAAGGNALSATANTVPEVLKGVVACLVVEQAQTRIPGLAVSADQRRQADEARALLARIASGLVKVEAPTNPDTSLTPKSQVEAIGYRNERMNSDKLNTF